MRPINRSRTRDWRDDERGAALITMLLVATLILTAGFTLIASTASVAINAFDSITERQSYYAAEAGLQAALNVLRGNMQPDGAVTAGTKINFRSATLPDLSNGAGRSGGNTAVCDNTAAGTSRCRLAGWLPYADPANANSNIALANGTAFRVSAYDPDNSQNVTFSTSGTFTPLGGLPIVTTVADGGRSLLIGVVPNQIKVEYVPPATTTLMNALPSAATNFGSFRVTGTSLVALPASTNLAKFNLTISQSAPWQASTTFKTTLVTPAAAACPAEQFFLLFDKVKMTADGTSFSQTSLNVQSQLLLPCAAGIGPGTAQMQGTVTAPEPKQLVIRSLGFGPKWSQKRLELTVNRSNLDFEPPATITMRGADNCAPLTMNTGASNAKTYTGQDKDNPSAPPLPAFAVTACDVANAESGIQKHDTVSDPEIGVLNNGTPPVGTATTVPTTPVDTPGFLKDADAARAFLNELEAAARAEGRYFKPAAGSSRTVTDADGTVDIPGFTFIDGDCNLDTTANSGGLLIVTGNLEMAGNPSFNGVVLVMGGGSVNRDGGGSGAINGSMVVSKFQRTWPPADDNPAIANKIEFPFLAPTFNTNGGGASSMQFSSTAVASALNRFGVARVAGVLEY